MKSILITGISGFVGTNLVKYFTDNTDYKIFGLDINNPKIENVDKIWSWSELELIQNIDVVIHLAGKAHDLKNTSDEKAYFDINYGLTKTIFDWYHKSTATQFFLMSSVKAVADIVNGELTEDVVPKPITAYGKSKIMAEDYIKSVELPNDKDFYIFRPCMIHGPGNKGNLNLLYSVVSKGLPWPLASFDNKRSFLSVQNLAFVFSSFIDGNIKSGIYNISDNEPISTNKLIEIISEGVGKRFKLWHISITFIKFVAKIGDAIRLPLNSERLQKLTENYVVSNNKLKSVLSKELPLSSTSGLKLTVQSFSKKK